MLIYRNLPYSLFLCAVEQERDLLQPRPYWKEFRFDLTPLPKGETVTAAEFRIYKTLTVGQRANRTLHISVYEIKRENRHRFLLTFMSFFLYGSSPSLSWSQILDFSPTRPALGLLTACSLLIRGSYYYFIILNTFIKREIRSSLSLAPFMLF